MSVTLLIFWRLTQNSVAQSSSDKCPWLEPPSVIDWSRNDNNDPAGTPNTNDNTVLLPRRQPPLQEQPMVIRPAPAGPVLRSSQSQTQAWDALLETQPKNDGIGHVPKPSLNDMKSPTSKPRPQTIPKQTHSNSGSTRSKYQATSQYTDSEYDTASAESSGYSPRRISPQPKPSSKRHYIDPFSTCLTCHETFVHRSELFEHLEFNRHARDPLTLEPESYYRPPSSRQMDPLWLRKLLAEKYGLDLKISNKRNGGPTGLKGNSHYMPTGRRGSPGYRVREAGKVPYEPPILVKQQKSGFFSRFLARKPRRNGGL